MVFAYVCVAEGVELVVEAHMPGATCDGTNVMRSVLPRLGPDPPPSAQGRSSFVHDDATTVYILRSELKRPLQLPTPAGSASEPPPGTGGGGQLRYIAVMVNERQPSQQAWALLTEVRRAWERQGVPHSLSSVSSVSSIASTSSADVRNAVARRAVMFPAPLPPTPEVRRSGAGKGAATGAGAGGAAGGEDGSHSSGSGGSGAGGPGTSGVVTQRGTIVHLPMGSKEDVTSMWLLTTMQDIALRYGRVQSAYDRGAMGTHHQAHLQQSHSTSSDQMGGMSVPLLESRSSAEPDEFAHAHAQLHGHAHAHDHGAHADSFASGAGALRKRNSCSRLMCIILSAIFLLALIVYGVFAAVCGGATLPSCQ